MKTSIKFLIFFCFTHTLLAQFMIDDIDMRQSRPTITMVSNDWCFYIGHDGTVGIEPNSRLADLSKMSAMAPAGSVDVKKISSLIEEKLHLKEPAKELWQGGILAGVIDEETRTIHTVPVHAVDLWNSIVDQITPKIIVYPWSEFNEIVKTKKLRIEELDDITDAQKIIDTQDEKPTKELINEKSTKENTILDTTFQLSPEIELKKAITNIPVTPVQRQEEFGIKMNCIIGISLLLALTILFLWLRRR